MGMGLGMGQALRCQQLPIVAYSKLVLAFHNKKYSKFRCRFMMEMEHSSDIMKLCLFS